MATSRPRKNLYVEPEHADLLKSTAEEQGVSESAMLREILSFYFALKADPAFKAMEKLAYMKAVNKTTVVISALNKAIPDKYYNYE